jgi:hypothetical protein
MPATSIHATLTRHFLRRFLENDLISPEADRAQLLAVVGAALFSVTLMTTLFMSFGYVTGGWTPPFLHRVVDDGERAAGSGAMGFAGR